MLTFGKWSNLGLFFGCLLLFSSSSSAIPTETSSSTAPQIQNATGYPACDALIKAGLGNRLLVATEDLYDARIESWWYANGRLHPWCLVQPHNTHEVSTALVALTNHSAGEYNWHIAVRSGGHGIPGSNNIDNGVTIDLGHMNNSFYDPVRQLASVEPGARWKDVYANLLKNGNVTVTGGRDGDVGVGGFLLGGGNSYFSGRNGFGCDTVANFEVVLANGTVINANATANPDLWKALKGGSSNFGIVTRYDMLAMPAHDIAYGQSAFSSNVSDDLIDAFVDFTNHPESLADDALITIYTHDTEVSPEITMLVIRVNTQGVNTTSFDKLNAIPAISTSWETISHAAAAAGSEVAAGTRNAQSTRTFLNNPEILRYCVTQHAQLTKSLSTSIGADSFGLQMFLQPLPTFLSDAGKRQGGNVLGLDSVGKNAVLWTLGLYVRKQDDAMLAKAYAEITAMSARVNQFAKDMGGDVPLIYLNYADASQSPLGSYGQENVKLIREVAEKYDPQGVFQRAIPGGFKIPRAVDGA